MCGLAGFWEKTTRASVDDLRCMQTVLGHRGPDDAGVFYEAGIGLAHARLAIIDLSAQGHQPMRRGDHTLVYNGEIYNYRILRKELRSLGCEFTSDSDTEVVLQAFRCWGPDAFRRFSGMFALAIYDHRTRDLVLARDRAGIKPLFYFSAEDVFVFASEIKALACHPAFRRELSREGLRAYLTLGYTTGGQSIWKDVRRLLPGEYLVIDGKTGKQRVTSYWEGYFHDEHKYRFPAAVDKLQGILKEEFFQSLISDVPVAACISGGVDSNILTAILTRDHKVPLKTFSLGSRDARFDENRQAAAVARYFETDHTSIVLDPAESRQVWEQTVRHTDEPLADPNILSLRVIAREARKRGIRVLLSGLGGDELFLGYPDVALRARMPLFYRVPAFLRKALPRAAFSGHNKIYKALHLLQQDNAIDAIAGLTGKCFLDDEIARLSPFAGDEGRLRRTLEGWMMGAGGKRRHRLYGIMQIDFKSYLTDNGLALSDMSTMAEGVEMRVPFLNPAVMEFALGIPAGVKTRGGKSKALLRAIERRYLPPELLMAGKRGFDPFQKSVWLDREFRANVDHYLSRDYLTRQGFFDPGEVEALRTLHTAGRINAADKIWNLLVFQVWYDHHLREPAPIPSRPAAVAR